MQTPFKYNPNNGNLLLDITIQDAEASYENFDAVSGFPSITQRVQSDDPGSETGTVRDTGLVTQFACRPLDNVPTLSEWGLIAMAGALGIIGLLAMRRRKVTA